MLPLSSIGPTEYILLLLLFAGFFSFWILLIFMRVTRRLNDCHAMLSELVQAKRAQPSAPPMR